MSDPQMYTKILQIISVSALVVLFSFVGVWVYEEVAPPPLKLNKSIEVIGSKFYPDSMLEYRMDYCKADVSDVAEVHYALTSTFTYPLTGMAVTRLPPGCHVAETRITVPDVPPGTYVLDMVRIYHGAIRDRLVTSTSQPFEVLPLPTGEK